MTTEPGGTPSPWAEQDRAALVGGGWLGRPAADPAANPSRDQVRLRLRALANTRRSQPVTVYLSAPAGVDEAGGAYLLPADPLGDTPRNRLPLADVLALLRECPARHKLLVLQLVPTAGESPADPPGGDLSAAVFRDLDHNPDPGRLALVACGPGQVPQAAPSLGRTAFGHYLEAGLRGAADGWCPDGVRDGRVTACELAAFVRHRVERWATTAGTAPQSPVLVGDGPDFTLRSVPLGSTAADESDAPIAIVVASTDTVAPGFLKAGWERRDAWLSDGRAAAAPAAFRRLQATLLNAERGWLGGRPAADVQRELDRQSAAADALAAALAAVPAPDPVPTIAAARPGPADRAVLDELRTAVIRDESRPPAAVAAAPAGTAPLPAEFDALRSKAHAEVAAAAFELLAADPAPTAGRVRRLNHLLAAQEPQPRFAETLLLRRLAELADVAGPARWPAEAVGSTVRGAAALEGATARPEVVAWAGPAADEAYRLRADAEAALFAPGFVSAAEVDRRLSLAAAAARRLATAAAALRSARAAAGEAAAWLAAGGPLVAAGLVPPAAAFAFPDAVRELGDHLTVPAEPLDGAAVAGRAVEWQRREARVRETLAEFSRPCRGPAVAALRARAEGSDAGPAVLAEIDVLLSTPLLAAADRVALLDARATLGLRLSDDVRRKDRFDDEAYAKGLATPPAADTRVPSRVPAGGPSGTVRSEWAAAVLRAGGVDTSAAKARRLWLDPQAELYARLDPGAADRVSRVGPPVPAFDRPESNPTAAVRRRQARDLWAWHAARFDYEGHNPIGPTPSDTGIEFSIVAARACRAAAGPGPDVPYVELAWAKPPTLSPDAPRGDIAVSLRLLGTPAPRPVRPRVSSPAPAWVRAAVPDRPLEPAPVRAVPFDIAVEAGDRPAAFPDLKGVFAEVEVGGRTFHRRIPVGTTALVNRLELLVRTDPKGAPAAAREVRLRPTGVPVPHYFLLSNPTATARTVVARLAGTARETPPLTVPPGDFRPLTFPPPAAPQVGRAQAASPGTAAPEFDRLGGPLVVELLAPDTREVVQTLTVPVRVADPGQYLTVDEVLFQPAGGGKPNRLSVRVVPGTPLGQPPCPVELALPADRNPGLLVRDGKLRGTLPADGRPLTLYTENLLFDNPSGADVVATVSADGTGRAFTYTGALSAGGEPARLAPVVRPLVRIKADPFATGTEPFPVGLEVDNPPDGGRVELRLGSRTADGFAADATVGPVPAKDRTAGVTFAPDGAVLLRGTLADPRLTLPVELLVGTREIEARVLDRSGAVVAEDRATVTFDGRPPAGVRFLDLAPRYRKDQPLPLKATCDPAVSGLKEVKFFLGKPVDNGPPPNAPVVAGALVDPRANVWAAAVPLPAAAQPGPVEVGVQFVTKAGRAAAASGTVELADPAEMARPQPARVSGTVAEGPRPQAGLEVALYDATGAEKGRKKTAADGAFAFDGLAPGRYVLYAAKQESNRQARRDVELKAGDDKAVSLELLLP